MTCIVAVAKNNKVYMGGDSAVSYGWHTRVTQDKKIFKCNKMLIGCAGFLRAGQIIKYNLLNTILSEPAYGENSEYYIEYLINYFTPLVKDILRKERILEKKDLPESMDGSILIGVSGRLFYIDESFGVCEEQHFSAIGSGANYALGALYICHNNEINMEPEDMINEALYAADYFNNGVEPPFYMEIL